MMKWVKMEDQNDEDYDSNTRNISATGSKDFFLRVRVSNQLSMIIAII